jgi:cytosine/adenosine deaminase-related metal-dependent hydrolase
VWECTEHDVRLARELGLSWSCHTGAQGIPLNAPGAIGKLAELGLLGPEADFVHATNLTDEELKLVIDHGGSITIAPECECNFGHGHPVTGRVLALGGTPAFGVDVVSNISGDMFSVLRFGLQFERALVAEAHPRPTETLTLPTRDALEWGTIGNAKALGMDDRIGSLTPGKQADIILTRTDDINTCPVHDPVQTLIYMATPFNIDTVLIAGEIKKQAGKLVYTDTVLREKLSLLEASGRRILEQAGVFKRAAE